MTSKLLKRLPPLWKNRFQVLGRSAERRGLPLCIVGGCVRDLMLKKEPLDWDVVAQGAAAGLVQDAVAVFGVRMVHHSDFLTYTLFFSDGTSLDIATSRRETYPHAAALPVVEPADLSEDFFRRDFTVNAMAVHVTPARWGCLEDPFGGREDLRRGRIRVLHNKSFIDDPTRLFRAARYAGRYGWRLDPRTRGLLADAVGRKLPAGLTPARRRTELEKVLLESDPVSAMSLLYKQGAWVFWSPSWQWTPFVRRGLSPAAVKALGAAERDPLLFRLMILCRRQSPAEARTDLARLEFPRATADAVARTLQLLRHFERENFVPEESGRLSPLFRSFLHFALPRPGMVDRWEAAAPVLTGTDLQGLGYAPGPEYQRIFHALRQARWAGRLRTRADEIRHVIDNFPRGTALDPSRKDC